MARTAADLNTEIINRVNAGSKISANQVYDWMNEVKAEVQTQGSPFDFMRRVALIVMGSGTGTPGDLDTFVNSDVHLPFDFHAPINAYLVTTSGTALTTTQADLVFGAAAPNSLPLWWFPSFSTHVATGFTKTASGNTIYPYFANDPTFFFGALADLGVSVSPTPLPNRVTDGEGSTAGVLELRFVSFEQGRIREKIDTTQEITAVITGATLSNYSAINTAMTATPGYVNGPWLGGKKIEFGQYYEGLVGETWPILVLNYWATLPDYNAVSPTTLLGYTPTEDVFTRTAPRLLVYGTLEKCHEYLDDEERSSFYRQKREAEERKFRVMHAVTQVEARRQHAKLPIGTRVTGV